MKILKKLKLFILKLFKSKTPIYYMNGSETLPNAYTTEEELLKIAELLSGKQGVKDELIEHNLRLVIYIARKFDNTGVDLDDLISVGTIGLIKAVNTFNSDKNIKLATYASRCIENEILMHLRKVSKIKGEVSFDEPLNVDYEGNKLLLSDILGTDPEIVYKNSEDGEERRILKLALKKLSLREKQIMNMRFGLDGEEEFTQKEVADILGISQSYISRLEKRIIEGLRREMMGKI